MYMKISDKIVCLLIITACSGLICYYHHYIILVPYKQFIFSTVGQQAKPAESRGWGCFEWDVFYYFLSVHKTTLYPMLHLHTLDTKPLTRSLILAYFRVIQVIITIHRTKNRLFC